MSTEEGCGVTGDLNSDTLSTIFMDVNAINLGVTAELDWNPIIDPLLTTSSNDYELFLKKSDSSLHKYTNNTKFNTST